MARFYLYTWVCTYFLCSETALCVLSWKSFIACTRSALCYGTTLCLSLSGFGHFIVCLSLSDCVCHDLDRLQKYPPQFGILAKVVPTHWGIHFVGRGNFLPVYLRIHLFFVLWNCALPIPQLIGHSLDCLSRIGLRPARLDNLCDYPLQFGIYGKGSSVAWGDSSCRQWQ